MKSHALAKELIALGEAMLQAPNVETKGLMQSLIEPRDRSAKSNDAMVFGITTLAQLSKYTKFEWLNFASTHGIPIAFNERDSSRNIMGKIMSYLAENEGEIKRVRESVSETKETSNRLNSAFNILLRSTNER